MNINFNYFAKKETETKVEKTVRTKYVIKDPPVLDSKYLDYMEQARAAYFNFLPSFVSVRAIYPIYG